MVPRAPALPPDERRAAIVTAALGVLREKGQGATTREIAEAANVAEGTLFRAFGTKQELISAAMAHAFDPAPLLGELDAIDRSPSLQQRLVVAVGLVQHRYFEVFGLMHAMGLVHPPDHGRGDHEHHRRDHERHQQQGESWQQQVTDRLTALIEPDADQLRVPTDQLVDLVRLLTFAGSHPILTGGQPLSPATIVEVLLDGTRKVD